MKKSATLAELIVAIVLLGVIVLGISSFHLASDAFLRSSETKVEVVNELTFVLEHLHKNILQAKGDITCPGMQVISFGASGQRLELRHNAPPCAFDILYEFDPDAHTITFDDGPGPAVTLSERFVEDPYNDGSDFEIEAGLAANGGVIIRNLAFIYDPDDFTPGDIDDRNNPVATTIDTDGKDTVQFFSWSHSWN